jgi:transposase
MSTTLDGFCRMAVAIEISAAKWLVASSVGPGVRMRRKVLSQEDPRSRFEALLSEIGEARRRLAVSDKAVLLVAYEAGQEGFWLVRALRKAGLSAEVIDPVSLKVDRRGRRAKTDRLDAEALVRAVFEYASGDLAALRMVRVPSEEAEDAREWQRERDRLLCERTRLATRIRMKLRTQGIWQPPKDWRSGLRENRLLGFSGHLLGATLRAALMVELDRLEQVEGQQKAHEESLAALSAATRGKIAALAQLRGIGEVGSRSLMLLLFWRRFDNRRQVGSCTGLTGTPYDSGEQVQDQGISKAGDPRLRALLIELSWLWLRYQPGSALTQWFNQRTQGGGKRNKRVMIVAVARKLAIALWRYLEQGLVPEGARFKAAA